MVGAQAREGGGLSLGDADITSPKWPAGNRPYAYGSQFFEAAARSSSDSLIARYALRTAGPLLPWIGLSGAWRAEAGQSLGSTWQTWQLLVSGAGDRVSGAGDRVPGAGGQPVAGALRLSSAPKLSPDGTRLLLAHNDGRDATRLLVLDRRTGEQRRVGWLPGLGGVAWQPDGQALVSAIDFTDRYTTRSDLWRVDPASGGRRQVTHGARLIDPDVAPDGALAAVRIVPGGNELVLLDSSGAEARVIGPGGAGIEWATPRFSSDGGMIAAVRVLRGWHDIVVLNRAGGPWIEVTRDSVPDRQPAFTPDRRWLMWSRELDGVPQIVAVVADGDPGMPSARFTLEPYGAWGPAPAADSLYYLSYHADGFRLVSAPLAPMPWTLPTLTAPFRPAPPDSAPVTGEHDYQGLRSLYPRYWIPQLFAATGGGQWFGAFTSGSDVLERHNYALSLMLGGGALAGQWHGVLGYVLAGPGQAVLDLSISHQPQLADTSSAGAPAPVFCCLSDDAAHLGLSFVRRRTRSVWQLRTGVEYSKEAYERVGTSLAVSFANPVGAPLGISTQGGYRVSGSVRLRRRMYQDRSSGEYVLRVSTYRSFDAGQFARQVLALRVAGATSSGDDRPDFSVGGVSGGAFELVPGVSLGGAARTFQVRGYPPGYLAGPTALGGTLEHRVPLALIAKNLGLAPVGLDRLSAAAFLDVGATSSEQNCPSVINPGGQCSREIASLGAELMTDLVLGYTYPLRLRAGAAMRLAHDTGVGGYVAVGSAF